MKNKSKQQVQQELIRKLLGAVNSSEEFDFLKAESFQLSLFFSQLGLVQYQLNKFKEM